MLPADQASAGRRVPDVCSRHGNPATYREEITFTSRPPGWSYVLLLLGLLPFVVMYLATRRKVTVPAWPFCDECKAMRGKRGGVELVFVALFLLCIGASFVVHAPASRWLAGAAVVAAVAALLVNRLGGARMIAGAEVTRDGAWLRVRDASEAFHRKAGGASSGTKSTP